LPSDTSPRPKPKGQPNRKITKKDVEDVAQMIEHLPNKHEAPVAPKNLQMTIDNNNTLFQEARKKEF
jgi:hypothetical protein